MSSPRARARMYRLSVLAVVTAALVAERLHATLRVEPTDFDDAYMVLRYAHNALAGEWLAWNRGEAPVFGVSSLLHFCVVTMLRGALPSLPDATVLRLASVVPAFALIAILAVLCARFRPGRNSFTGHGLFLASALLVLLFHREAFLFHALTGMDTMLAAVGNAGVLFAALWLAERPSPARAVAAAAAGLIAIEARPDNAIIAVLCPLLGLMLLAPRPSRRALVVWAGTLASLMLLDVAVKWRFLGTPVPLAFYAKRPGYYGAFAGEFTWNPFLFLEVALSTVSPFLIAVVLFARRSSLRLLLVLLLPAGVTMAALFSFNQIMGHLGRFYFPSLPFFVVAGVLVTARWLRDQGHVPASPEIGLGPRRAGSVLCRLACALLGLGLGARALESAGRAYQAPARTQALASTGGYSVPATSPLPELDSWQASHEIARLAAEAPPGTTFAMSEHGLVGARASEAVIIDLVGLHDRIFARQGFSAAELWRRAPDAIWMPHPDYSQMLRDIFDSDELWRHYVFYPDAFAYGLALRFDGPRASILENLLSKRWRDSYPGLRMEDYAAAPDRRSDPGTEGQQHRGR